MFSHAHFCEVVFCTGLIAGLLLGQVTAAGQTGAAGSSYLALTTPRRVLPDAQPWEVNEFPHTLSVLELKRGGFRYWGWYGLNEGRGIGLTRSNDLVNWSKYAENPLWTNARWPSAIAHADPRNKATLYFAITRDYDTPSSRIVLASSQDGIHLKEEKELVAGAPDQRNQNPNLFRDPRSGRFYLTFYRGNDHDHFEIISRSATTVPDLDKAAEKILLQTNETVAAPTLLYVKNVPGAKEKKTGVYFLATEIYPHRYTDNPEGEWQVKVFAADSPDGNFQPGQSGHARTARVLVPAHFQKPVLRIRLPSGQPRSLGARGDRGFITVACSESGPQG